MAYAESADRMREDAPSLVHRNRTLKAWHEHWTKELQAEEKRNQKWRTSGDRVHYKFIDDRQAEPFDRTRTSVREYRMNLFHANTTTLMAFLYGRLPQADVSRRFADSADDSARVAANILQRMLNTSIETDGGDFNTVLRSVLEDHLVPGQGVARVSYEMEIEEVEVEVQSLNPETGEPETTVVKENRLVWEDAPIDYVYWRDFRWGHGRVWKNVPWVGFDVRMTRDQATTRFGAMVARQLSYTEQKDDEVGEQDQSKKKDPEETALVTEIWDKDSMSVYWYHESYPVVLDAKDDPLGLEGFFPVPRPFTANATTKLYQPRPYYVLSQDTYQEIDVLSTRINIITDAVRVVGARDKSQPGLADMFRSYENALIPVDNWAMFAEKGGLKGMIDFFPIEAVVATLDKLREMRREAIDLLYSTSGISDVMRGASDSPYESKAKTQLRSRMGSVRVQFLQDEFARFASDLLALKAEIISKHFEPQTIVQQSNILRSYDAQFAGEGIQLVKAWGAAEWRVEVKPESMAMIDWVKLKEERVEYINAIAIFLQSAAAVVQRYPESAPVLLELLKWGLAGFKGGQEIESVIDGAVRAIRQQMEAERNKPPPLNPEQIKAQLKAQEQQQKLQGDLMKQSQKAQAELQKLLAETRAELVKLQAETQATVIKETVQADQNIREKLAGGRA